MKTHTAGSSTPGVTGCREGKRGWEVTLDQTAFYPEGGGQPADEGTLGEAKVLDVKEGGEEVIHLCDRPLEPGSTVHGTLDWDRRFRFMQQHSGEHIFSGIVHRIFGYDNIGFHMGKDCVTVDFSGMLSEEDIAQVERAANEAVLADLEILEDYPSREELGGLDYRSKKGAGGTGADYHHPRIGCVRLLRYPRKAHRSDRPHQGCGFRAL